MKQTNFEKYSLCKKEWNDLAENQKKWRLINTLLSRQISFWFVCGQDVKEKFFEKIRQHNENYDIIRQEMIDVYMHSLKTNVYSGCVKKKINHFKTYLIIKDEKKDDL